MDQYVPVPNGEAREDFMRDARERNLVFYFRNPNNSYTNLGGFIDVDSTYLQVENLIGDRYDVDENHELVNNEDRNWLQYYMFNNGNVSRSNHNLYYSEPVPANITNQINAFNRAYSNVQEGGKKRKSKRSKSKRSNSRKRMRSQRRK